MKFQSLSLLALSVLLTAFFAPQALAGGPHFGPWEPAEPDLDTDNSVAGGCPHESRNGRTMYMASDRDGGHGDLDIWVAHRTNVDSPFGEATNLDEPVNSEYADFCPTPIGGKFLFFVSTRPHPDACDGGDMYITRNNPAHGWADPVNLGCAEEGEGPNTAGGEFSPSLVETKNGTFLFYSSNGTGDMDIYMSEMAKDGSFAPGVPVAELNTIYDDRMPNISKDGREIVFSSNRPTWGAGDPAIGGQDVYSSTRDSIYDPWSEPVNLGPGINTGADETRASMSWDRVRLHFGRMGEIYVSHRTKGKK